MCHRTDSLHGFGMLTDKKSLFEYTQDSCKVTCIVTGQKWKQNTYIVTHLPTLNTVIIDPGDNADLIIKYIQDCDGNVTRILLTHPHHDHVGAAAQVSEHFNVACELHKQDVRLLMHAPMYALRFADKTMTPVTNFQRFEALEMSSQAPNVKSIHTPGHTKGSVCYLFDGFVFTGDTLLYKHVGRTDLPGSSAPELSWSVSWLLEKLGDEITVFPGHGKPWTIGEAKVWWQESSLSPQIYNSFGHL